MLRKRQPSYPRVRLQSRSGSNPGLNSLRVRVTQARTMPMPDEVGAAARLRRRAQPLPSTAAGHHHQRQDQRFVDRRQRDRLSQPAARCCWKNTTATAAAMEAFNSTIAGKSTETKPTICAPLSIALEVDVAVQPHPGRRLQATARFESNPAKSSSAWAISAAASEHQGLHTRARRTVTRKQACPSCSPAWAMASCGNNQPSAR